MYSNCVLLVHLSLRKIDKATALQPPINQSLQTAILTPTDTPAFTETSTQSWKPSQKPTQNPSQKPTQPSYSQKPTQNAPYSQKPAQNPSQKPTQNASYKPSNTFSNPSAAAPAVTELVDLTRSSDDDSNDDDEAFEASMRPLSVQTDVLQQKLKHLEEFHTETVKYYEKELAAKQRTIHQLTQANREFEKLCVDSVLGESKTEDVLRLRNENEALKRRVREAEERWKRLQKENDELR